MPATDCRREMDAVVAAWKKDERSRRRVEERLTKLYVRAKKTNAVVRAEMK